MTRSKQIGTKFETAITRHAHPRGFPGADRMPLSGSKDRGDIGLCPGVIVEAKAGKAAESASWQQIRDWLSETEAERINAGADIAFLVVKQAGAGEKKIGQSAAYFRGNVWNVLTGPDLPVPDAMPVRVTFDDALVLLRLNGWGDPL